MEKIKLQRHLLFQAPSTYENWQMEMVRAVGTAKALGFTNFEMDVTARNVAKREEPKPDENGMYIVSFRWPSAQVDGDEWKSAKPDADKKNYKLVPEFLVQVWATQIEAV